MADGHFPTLVSKDRDANALANPIFTQLTDGTDTINITGTSLDVNVTNASLVVTATDLDIRDLTHVSDSVKVGDGTDFLAIAADGSIAVTDNGGSLTVDATQLDIDDLNATDDTVSIGDGTNELDLVVVHSAFGATPTAMPIAGKYEATPTTYDDGDATPLLVDENGRLQVDVISGGGSNASVKVDDSAFAVATDSVTVAGYLADETAPDSVNEGDTGAARMTLDRKQLMVMVDATTDSQRLAINASGRAAIDLEEHSLTNANALPVSANNTANSLTNPIFVQVTQDATSATEIHDYLTTASLGANSSDNHDYTVAGTTFLLKSVIGAFSGGGKIEIRTGPLATLATKAVAFVPKEGGFMQLNFNPAIEVPSTSTGTVRVIRTNRQNQTQDVYSTIIGNDVP